MYFEKSERDERYENVCRIIDVFCDFDLNMNVIGEGVAANDLDDISDLDGSDLEGAIEINIWPSRDELVALRDAINAYLNCSGSCLYYRDL
jgi:hypothetical protein